MKVPKKKFKEKLKFLKNLEILFQKNVQLAKRKIKTTKIEEKVLNLVGLELIISEDQK